MCCDVEAYTPVKSSSYMQSEVVFPDNSPTQEEGQSAYELIEDDQDRHDCIFDFLIIVYEIIKDIEVNGPSEDLENSDDPTSSGLEFLGGYQQAQTMKILLKEDIQEYNYHYVTGDSIHGPSVHGNPTILRISG